MKQAQDKVREFMVKAEQERPSKPTVPSDKITDLRVMLIEEELRELQDAFNEESPIAVADAIADLLYVVLGTAVACGIEIEPIFNEVHDSNMTKFIDGSFREDGKYIKGPSYRPANIEPLLDA